ncbi:MAG: cellulose binding domain-containing protein, partial [Pirellulales bacterium]
MNSRAFYDNVSDWVGRTLTGRFTRQRRRAFERQRRRLNKHSHSLSTETLEKRTVLAAVIPGYEVINDWGSGFQGAVTLNNQDTQSYSDWTVSFDYGAQISSIWDAKIIGQDGTRYTVSNAGYNSELDSGRSLTFGFIGAPTENGGADNAPYSYSINGDSFDGEPLVPIEQEDSPSPGPQPAPNPETSDPAISFSVTSDWGSGFTGDVTLANRNLSSDARNGGDSKSTGWAV